MVAKDRKKYNKGDSVIRNQDTQDFSVFLPMNKSMIDQEEDYSSDKRFHHDTLEVRKYKSEIEQMAGDESSPLKRHEDTYKKQVSKIIYEDEE